MPGIVKIAFLADVGAAKVGLTQFASDVDGTVGKVGKSWAGLKDKLKLGALAGAAALGAGLAEGLDFGAAQSKLKAQLGLAGADAEKIGKAAGDLYKGGFGESVESAGDTIKAAFQNGIVGIKSTREEIVGVGQDIENYIVLSGEDATKTTEAVAQILKNKLAPNAKAAFDLLVRGQQLGVNKAEDLLDTFNEYSTEFRQLGLDGPKALGLLSQGLQAGARDADTVADALKEFAIRAKDGSATTVDGFKSIGLNAKAMQKVFAAGGPAAAAGLDQVLDKLRLVKDPAEQSRIAVELFGTKAEDLQAALFALDPSKAVKGLGDLAGASDRAGATLNDNAKARLTSFTRTLKLNVVDFLGTKVIPKVEEWGNAFKDKVQPKLDVFVDRTLPKVKTGIETVTTFIADNKQEFLDLGANAADLAVNVGDKLAPALERLGPPLKVLGEIDLTNAIGALTSLNQLLDGKGVDGGKSGLADKFKQVIDVTSKLDPTTPVKQFLGRFIGTFVTSFASDGTVRAAVGSWMLRNFDNLIAFLPFGSLINAGLMAGKKVSDGLFGATPTAAATARRFMSGLGGVIQSANPIGLLTNQGLLAGRAIGGGLGGAAGFIGGKAKGIMQFLGRAVVNASPVGPIVAMASALGKDLVGGLAKGVTGSVGIALSAVRSIPGRLAANGGNWGGALIGAGKQVIAGLVSGIRSAIPDVHSILSSVTSIIPSWKGPLDKDKVLLRPAGQAIMGGLIGGIESQLPDLKRSLFGVSAGIESGLSAKPTVELSATASLAARAASVGAAAGQVVVNVYALAGGPEVGRAAVDAIREYERFNGAAWRAVPA